MLLSGTPTNELLRLIMGFSLQLVRLCVVWGGVSPHEKSVSYLQFNGEHLISCVYCLFWHLQFVFLTYSNLASNNIIILHLQLLNFTAVTFIPALIDQDILVTFVINTVVRCLCFICDYILKKLCSHKEREFYYWSIYFKDSISIPLILFFLGMDVLDANINVDFILLLFPQKILISAS